MSNRAAPPPASPVEHWDKMARQWDLVVHPLRPGPEDIAGFKQLIDQWHGAKMRVLLLGVTPELYRLPWPVDRDFLAIDHAPEMLEKVWQGPREEARMIDWVELPLPSASRDIAVCDGGLQLLSHVSGQHQLVDRLHDVLAPGGRFIVRLFSPAEPSETVEAVLEDLFACRVPNLSVLKIRLGTAMQPSLAEGILVSDIWQRLWKAGGSWQTLAPRIGWSVEELAVIDTYRDSTSRYHFLTANDAEALFCKGGKFAISGRYTPNYPFGERCPILSFERL